MGSFKISVLALFLGLFCLGVSTASATRREERSPTTYEFPKINDSMRGVLSPSIAKFLGNIPRTNLWVLGFLMEHPHFQSELFQIIQMSPDFSSREKRIKEAENLLREGDFFRSNGEPLVRGLYYMLAANFYCSVRIGARGLFQHAAEIFEKYLNKTNDPNNIYLRMTIADAYHQGGVFKKSDKYFRALHELTQRNDAEIEGPLAARDVFSEREIFFAAWRFVKEP